MRVIQVVSVGASGAAWERDRAVESAVARNSRSGASVSVIPVLKQQKPAFFFWPPLQLMTVAEGQSQKAILDKLRWKGCMTFLDRVQQRQALSWVR